MRVHHDKHHQAYVDKVNAALEGTEWADKADRGGPQEPRRAAVRQAEAGPQQRRRPLQPLAVLGVDEPGRRRRARRRAGRRDRFRVRLVLRLPGEVQGAGVNQFGSGWAWLVHDGSGLAVVGTPNQDNPISAGQTPLLGVDVWEHAYYLKYQNKRPDYIDAWWNVVNWAKVGEGFSAAS